MERIVTYFADLADRFGASPAGVGWSEASQRTRFDVIATIGDLSRASLLDVGCGYGAFLDYASARGIRCDYSGVDVTPQQIALATARHPESRHRFQLGNVLTDLPTGQYDYVIASGPLNTACGSPHETMRSLVQTMYRLCRIGCVVTMVSARAPRRLEYLHYYEPEAMLSVGLDLSPRVRLDHSYLPHDFALFCYK